MVMSSLVFSDDKSELYKTQNIFNCVSTPLMDGQTPAEVLKLAHPSQGVKVFAFSQFLLHPC